jgi:ATP-dependent RNA helicase RhlE
VLVATDLAARGIDVDGITHVINYELPDVPETYVHRIGRTARAGASGTAISLCAADERDSLRGIEKLIRRSVPVVGAAPPMHRESPRRELSRRDSAERDAAKRDSAKRSQYGRRRRMRRRA